MFVGFHDALYEGMAHYVFLPEFNFTYAGHVAEHF